ncbi:plant U-box 24 [Raphanus sativus]|uniref:U-box domain-containing protein n=1 Tax=Raphanus sativus TaxID=3726 RepID=A0A9W3DTN5_RAPSA|nr:E3 ubiquitin-protein ligase PUB24-like [Raphanus sativus]KAJ4898184.1 plant U-box 24 [Raphanus sativus]
MDHEDEEIEIPSYFICPISLDIMKDPVIAVSGITYDRESIFKWLEEVSSCPVTKQPIPSDSDLTPNHTLRRLIQHWCVENATRGVERIPTPRDPPGKPDVFEEIKNLKKFVEKGLGREDTLKKLEVLAMEGETNRRLMYEADVHRSLILFVVKCTREQEEEEGQPRIKVQLDESLRLLHLLGVPLHDARTILMENDQILDSLSLVLNQQNFLNKAYTIVLLRNLTVNTSSHIVERLNPEILKGIIGFLKEVVSSFNRTSPNVSDTAQSSNPRLRNKEPSKLDYSLVIKQAVTAALMILLETSSWSGNRINLVDLGAVSQLIELEISSTGDKRATELVLGVLSRLCCCTNGRADILAHGGGLAIVTKRLLGVSIAADDRALSILSTVSKFSPEKAVVEEMVCVGTVEKLCTVLRVDCGLSLKEKAKEILRDHFDEWKKFPCFDVTLLTKLLNSSHEDLLAEFHSQVNV